jgi:hypothetical protein
MIYPPLKRPRALSHISGTVNGLHCYAALLKRYAATDDQASDSYPAIRFP